MLSIYYFNNASNYLKSAWKEKRKQNPNFSLRSWAKKLGLSSHTSLNLILNGKRNIPKKYVPLLIKSLDLNKKEALFLETLVDLQKSKNESDKEYYFSRLRELTPKNSAIHFVELDQFNYLRDPLHYLLVEMVELPDFRYDPKWIQEKLTFKVSLYEINDAFNRLLDLNIIQEKDHEYIRTYNHISTEPDVECKATQEFHKAASRLAEEIISKQPVEDRDYNSYSIRVEKKSIPKAKELIRKFISDFAEVIEATPEKSEEVYQLNVQFFGLTKHIDEVSQ